MTYEKEILTSLYSILDFMSCNNGTKEETEMINKRINELETKIKNHLNK